MSAINAAALDAANQFQKNVVTNIMQPLAEVLVERASPKPGERAVDVAAGTGVVARLVTSRVGAEGQVVAVDINPAMLAVGRMQPDGDRVEWREGDAHALPLPDDEYDLAFCQHGLQFFSDGVAALRDVRRVLKCGGRLALSVWGPLEHHPTWKLMWSTVARHLQTTVETFAIGFSRSDAMSLRRTIEEAGFSEVTVSLYPTVVREPNAPGRIAGLLRAVRQLVPPLGVMSDDELAALGRRIESEIAPEMEKYIQGDWIVAPASVQIAMGRA